MIRRRKTGTRGTRLLLCIAMVVGLLPALAGPAAAVTTTYWVDDSGSDANPGTEAQPFKTITKASQTAGSGDTIMVKPGTYNAASGEVFPINLDGESLMSTGGSAVTMLEGDAAHGIVMTNYMTENDRISGFHFKGGGDSPGAGVWVHLNLDTGPGSVYVEDNVFEDNHSTYNGGGLYLGTWGTGARNAVVRRNVFKYNSCGGSFHGGGLHADGLTQLTIAENNFFENEGWVGGAIAVIDPAGPVEIRDNRISGNEAESRGGGLYLKGQTLRGAAVLTGNEISSNIAVSNFGYGGGLYAENVDAELVGNDLRNNTANYGALGYLTNATVTAKNNAIFGGSSQVDGAAWYVTDASQLTEAHDTVAENGGVGTITHATPESTLSITNSIYWNSWLPVEIRGADGADGLSYTCVEPDSGMPSIVDSVVGDGVIDDDPLFFDPLHGDCRLSAGSPCIDSANPAAAAATDYFGSVRPADGDFDGVAAPDMGYQEFSATVSLSAPAHPAYRSARLAGRVYDAQGIPLGGMQLVLEYSYNGSDWNKLGVDTTDATDAKGPLFEYPGRPSKKTFYRARFGGSVGNVHAAKSVVRTVLPQVRLTRLTSWKTLTSGSTYTARGYIEPYHGTGNTNKVKIKAYRKKSDGSWDYVKAFTAKYVYESKSKTLYRANVVLSAKDDWKLVAYHATDSTNYRTYGSPDYVTVK